MDRYCGILQRAILSRHFPNASVNRFIADKAQLDQIAKLYDIGEVLALRSTSSLPGTFSRPECT